MQTLFVQEASQYGSLKEVGNKLRNIFRQLKYMVWVLNGYVGRRYRLTGSPKVVVLITYYSPVRMRHINHQIRNIFKCDFVEKIIISNHNPIVQIDTLVKVKDKRLVILNQKTRRGCGHRWQVANEFSPEYLIVLDDDILIFARQLRVLFEALIAEPEMPHGFAGMVDQEGGFLEYRQKETRSVDYLCEVYAVTGEHLKQYKVLKDKFLNVDASLGKLIEFSTDFIIVSKTGIREPRIHNAGRLFRCPTYNQVNVAVHKEQKFNKDIIETVRAMNSVFNLGISKDGWRDPNGISG